MIVRILLMVSLFLVASCTTSQDALNGLSEKWVGRPADDFFSRYGIPGRQFALKNGDTLYEWSSSNSFYVPPTTTVSGSVSPVTGQFQATANTTGGNNVNIVCVIQFTVGKEGLIDQISVLKDSWGYWQTSRCNELFN